MTLTFAEMTHSNYPLACRIDRSDVSEDFVDTAETLMELTDYAVRHRCLGHTFLIQSGSVPIGLLLLGEAIPWETDPEPMHHAPFYRLMGFVLDKAYRNQGLGSKILEEAISRVYADFGRRSIALGCHRENIMAAHFYERHGFVRTGVFEGEDEYFLRLLPPAAAQSPQ